LRENPNHCEEELAASRDTFPKKRGAGGAVLAVRVSLGPAANQTGWNEAPSTGFLGAEGKARRLIEV